MPSSYKPEGWHSVTPRLTADDARGLVVFLKEAFHAQGEFRPDGPSQMRIGDSMMMVDQAGMRKAAAATLYLYVEDADAAYGRAMTAGAQAVEVPFDTHYGDRRAMVRDPAGNLWQIATHRQDVPLAQIRRRLARP